MKKAVTASAEGGSSQKSKLWLYLVIVCFTLSYIYLLDLEAVLAAQVDRSELLARPLELEAGGEAVVESVHLGHLARPPHPGQDLLR